MVSIDSQATAPATEGLTHGWFADPTAWWQVALWAAALAGVAAAAYLLSRRTRWLWLGPIIAVLPFLVALYFFYQNVNRLLPPDL